jgi:hypothetical protein
VFGGTTESDHQAHNLGEDVVIALDLLTFQHNYK